jgi:hypothetical protein
MIDYRIPYYKWQAKLETNQKWTATEVDAMFTELMEQCTARIRLEQSVADFYKLISRWLSKGNAEPMWYADFKTFVRTIYAEVNNE